MIPKQLAQYKDFTPETLISPGLRGTSEKGTAPGPVRDKQKVYFDGMAARHGVGMEGVFDFRDPEQRGLNSLSTVMDRFDPATGKFSAVSHPGGAPL